MIPKAARSVRAIWVNSLRNISDESSVERGLRSVESATRLSNGGFLLLIIIGLKLKKRGLWGLGGSFNITREDFACPLKSDNDGSNNAKSIGGKQNNPLNPPNPPSNSPSPPDYDFLSQHFADTVNDQPTTLHPPVCRWDIHGDRLLTRCAAPEPNADETGCVNCGASKPEVQP